VPDARTGDHPSFALGIPEVVDGVVPEDGLQYFAFRDREA